MKYIEISRDSLMSEIPYTIYYLEKIDVETQEDGLEIHIRDTDHTHSSIRIEYSNYKKYSEWDKQIRKYLHCHCCKCGRLDNNIQFYYGDDCFEWALCGLCEECAIRENQSKHAFILYQIEKQSKEKSYRANHIKVRLKTKNGKVIYRFADEILFIDNAYTIVNKFNPVDSETVLIAGFDLGIRDITDERIFEGDILLAETFDGRICYGMIIEVNNKRAWCHEPNPQFKNFFLSHGGHNFPSPLNWMRKFKVIGHIADISNFDGKELSDIHYDQWCIENKELLDRVYNKTLDIEDF